MQTTKPHSRTRITQALMTCAGLALGGAGTATAQSTVNTSTDVTLYGLVDLSLIVARGDNARKTGLIDGTNYGPGSRWGLRVSEDLGSGLKTGAVLESGFFATTGARAQGGRMFGRQSFLYLRSDQFGELRIGRQYALHDETQAVINPTGGATALNPAGVYTVTTKAGTQGLFNPLLSAPRIDNTAQLISPRFGGFQAKFMYAFGSGTQDIYRAVKLDYTGGPLYVVATHERSSALNTPANGNASVNNVTAFGGSYDFTVVKLFAGYERVKDMTQGIGTQMNTVDLPGLAGDATQLKAFTVGASVPVGDVTYAANFVRSRLGNDAGQHVSVSRYGASAVWQLSKRTAVYGAFALTGGDLKRHVYEKRIGQIGLRHRF